MSNHDGYGLPVVYVKYLCHNAQLPSKGQKDAGWDLYSVEDVTINGGEYKTIKTGIALQIPEEWVGLIWPRSGLSVKHGIDVLAGVVDSGYRGEIMVCLYNATIPLPLFETSNDVAVHIKAGDRIAQILFQKVPYISLEKTEELEESKRGTKGFGSSGK